MKNDYLHTVRGLINDAAFGLPLDYAAGVHGYSGKRLITLLKRAAERLLRPEKTVYLEIGIFKGLTLLSVGDHLKTATDSPAQIYGIDNFSQFDTDGENKATVEKGMKRLNLDRVHLINHDFEDALSRLSDFIDNQKVGVYFIDGPHDYRSQLMCLQMALPYLADDCLIVIDDCNYQHVRLATKDFLTCFPEFKLAFEGYTRCHPKNALAEEELQFRQTWWNGVNVIVRDKANQLETMLPAIGLARELCQSEHELQAFKFADQMVYGRHTLLYAGRLATFPGFLNPMNWAQAFRGARQLNQESNSQRFNSMNTYSQELPDSNINPGLG